jgi:hypothetical protein
VLHYTSMERLAKDEHSSLIGPIYMLGIKYCEYSP